MDCLLRARFLFIRMLACSLLLATMPASSEAQNAGAVGSDALAVGKVRSTLSAERAAIAAHPTDPAVYIDLAYTLSDDGMGEMADKAARKATEVAPQSSFAFSAYGWVLHHNAISVDYGSGYDYHASIAAYQKAIELAPGDLDVRQSFADSLEFDANGIRYATDADLTEAIKALRYIKARQRVVDPSVENNLLIDLFYNGQYKEVAAEMIEPATPVRDGVGLAALAAANGSAAAIAAANHIEGDPQRRSAALNFAAEGLWNRRMYAQAADLLSAGLLEGSDESTTLRKIALFRNLKPFDGNYLPADDPRSPVQRVLFGALSGSLTEAELSAQMNRQMFGSEAQWQGFVELTRRNAGMLHALEVKTGLPGIAMQDIVFGSTQLMLEPGNAPGYRIVAQVMGLPALHYFVLKDDGVFRIAATAGDPETTGSAALYLLRQDREAEARALLDWYRQQVQAGAGDDPLAGSVFARFWTSGENAEPEAIELAAAALLGGRGDTAVPLPRLITLRKRASSQAAKTNLDLVLTAILLQQGDGAGAMQSSQQLLAQFPDSPTALHMAGAADRLAKDWAAWTAMLDARLAKRPGDRVLLEQKAEEAEGEGELAQARETLHTLLESGNAVDADYNAYAWLSLSMKSVDAQAVQAAEQANLLSRGASFADLDTLACVYAAAGRTTEARQFLLQAMSSANLAEPNGPVWFGFGLIDEQYGVAEAAAAAYQRVEKPEGLTNPMDTYVLAQARLKALDRNQTQPGG